MPVSLNIVLAGAQVIACREGAVSTDQVFGRKARALVASLNIEAQHRCAVAAALADGSDEAQPTKKPKVGAWKQHSLNAGCCSSAIGYKKFYQPCAAAQRDGNLLAEEVQPKICEGVSYAIADTNTSQLRTSMWTGLCSWLAVQYTN